MINREELRKKVPHGGNKEIAKRAGVSYVHVSNYFSGKINSEAIEMALLEYLAEKSAQNKVTEQRKAELLSQIL